MIRIIAILLVLVFGAIPLATTEGIAKTEATGAVESEATVEAELRVAKRLVRAGHFAQAVEAYLAVAKRLPQHRLSEYAHYTAASLYHRQLKDTGRALELYQRLVKTYPNDLTTGEAQVRIASILAELGRYEEAFKAYGKAIRMNVEYNEGATVPEWVSRIHILVEGLIAHISSENKDAKMKLLEQFAEEAGIGASWVIVGDGYHELGDIDSAKRSYLHAISGRIDSGVLRHISQQLDDASAVAAELGLIDTWYLIGPFDGGTDMGVSTVHPPEHEVRLDATYEGKTEKVAWKLYTALDSFGEVDLRGAVANLTNAVAYAYCTVHAPLSTVAFLRLGTDDTNVVWLNGEHLHESSEGRGIVMDNNIIPLKLKAGENTLLIKIGQGTGAWKFIARIVDAEGKAIQGIHTKPLPATGKEKK